MRNLTNLSGFCGWYIIATNPNSFNRGVNNSNKSVFWILRHTVQGFNKIAFNPISFFCLFFSFYFHDVLYVGFVFRSLFFAKINIIILNRNS